MNLVRNCRMMARGDDWVKLLVDVAYNDRIPCVEKLKNEHDLLWHRLKVSHPAMGDGPGGYGMPKVMKSGLWNDRVVFKFRVKPYSEEVNDLFQYVYDFGELAGKRSERVEATDRLNKTIDKMFPASTYATGEAFDKLANISESIRKFAEKNCVDDAIGGKPFRHRIKVPDVKIITVEELARMQKEKELGSGLQVVPDGAGVSMTEPGIRFGDREVRSLASRFAKHGII